MKKPLFALCPNCLFQAAQKALQRIAVKFLAAFFGENSGKKAVIDYAKFGAKNHVYAVSGAVPLDFVVLVFCVTHCVKILVLIFG